MIRHFMNVNVYSIKIFIIIFIFHIVAVPTYGVVNRFTHLTIQDGLSQSTVTSIFQDSSGFLWFGTENGLNRYDGSIFKKYLTSFRDSSSLTDPGVNAIVEDYKGNMWIGTYGGINILNPNTERFTHIRPEGTNLKVMNNNITSLYKDQDNCIWAGSSTGISKYRYIKKQNSQDSLVQVPFNFARNSILKKRIVDIGQFDAKTFWILTPDSLGFIANDGTSKKLPLNLTLPPNAINLQCVLWLEGKIYLGCSNGLFYFNLNDTKTGWIEKLYEGNSIKNISFIKQDFKNNIWIGTTENGVLVLNLDSNIFQNLRHKEILSKSLNNDFTRAMLVTNSGLVVIGTNFGVNFYDEKQQLFNQLAISNEKGNLFQNIHGMLEDRNGNIWFGTKGGGVFIYDTKGELIINLREYIHGTNMFSDNIQCIHQDLNGVIWVGSLSSGLFKIVFQGNNYSSPKIYHYEHTENDHYSILSNEIDAIFEDLNGDLWFGTSNGLCRLLQTEKNKLPNDARFVAFNYPPQNDAKRTPESVYSIYRDRLGTFWIGTLGCGLIRINNMSVTDNIDLNENSKSGSTIIRYIKEQNDLKSIAGNEVYSIYEDKLYGNLWIATNEGLCRFNRSSNDFKNFTVENGLAGNIIYGILEDYKGCLWISTNRGISKYNQEQDVFYNYDEADGLQYPEFNGKAYLKTHKGLLIFGGPMGINSFYPEKIKSNSYLFPVYITGVRVNNHEIEPGDQTKIFSSPIHKTSKIVLNYNQNFLTFSFVLLNFQKSDLNRFAYKLKGYDDDWIYTDGDNVAKYTGLPPGTYEFMVNGSDEYSLWDTESQKMIVVIKPPLWLTSWAICFYVLLIGVIVYFFKKEYKKRVKLKSDIERQTLAIKSNKEYYEDKLEFFTKLSHEFLTPLSLIIGPTYDLILEQKEPKTSKKLKIINRNAVRLKDLIDQFLSFRKIDAGQMPICVLKDNIELFIKKVASGFNSLAARKNIHYVFDLKESSGNVWFDHDVVEKILYNLLSNAFKHTKDGGEIKVVLSVVTGTYIKKIFEEAHLKTVVCENYVAIEVKDNGIGISKDFQSRIFERYFQVDKRIDGAGVGLSFAQSLAQLHKGTITVKSKLEKGSSFTYYLPIGDCYDDKQKIEDQNNLSYPSFLFEPFPLLNEVSNKNSKELATILIVEDNEEMRYYVADALLKAYNVITAKNGEDAIKKLESSRVDLIICDIVMPVMDGIEFMRHFRKLSKDIIVPIILLSARIDILQKVPGIELGVGAYISKPFNMDYLLSVIHRLLEQTSLLQTKHNNSALEIKISSDLESIKSKLLIKLKSSIEKHCLDPNFKVVSLANDIGLSRSQLYRKFKASTGTTPSNFVKDIRMKEAAHLLENTDKGISEICFAVGFSDAKYFSKEFNKKFGMNPSKYAETFRVGIE